ncbi:MAG TPA: 5-deoxy-glucuronate isomerase [Candidatus Acidoferrales bacterium]|nr:5-deoxy-glucuronate isomerase [Candidatus Acidoferrales bacterium]
MKLRTPSTERDASRRVLNLTPGRAGWRYVGFEVVRLAQGEAIARETRDREACLVWLSGVCSLTVGSERWARVGGRASPFDGPPAAAYIPPEERMRIRALDASDVAIGWAPATPGRAPRVYEDARVEQRGEGVMSRTIHQILMEDREAERLLVTEVLTPAGHWSSYPPHKHDTDDPPNETYLEETYYFRFRDPRGFALQRVYTADRSVDESVAARDGDLVVVPRGYHTVSAAPGYETYYLNVMAGPRREWKITFDPDHERMRW